MNLYEPVLININYVYKRTPTPLYTFLVGGMVEANRPIFQSFFNRLFLQKKMTNTKLSTINIYIEFYNDHRILQKTINKTMEKEYIFDKFVGKNSY